ncbi:MAG TPA: C45 family peptidase [Casimicrobiaceae bacterium]|nr:C45 family peptidase [Casimicrobiaceae bacterium]
MSQAEAVDLGLPHLVLRGTPYERGRRYGQLARERILRSLALYRDVFVHRAGLQWPDAVARAQRYEPHIAVFAPDCMDEMRGIADGAGVGKGDVLALNARSELMFAGTGAARDIEAMACECTSFALLPEVTGGRTIVGQNWDWLPFARETALVLEVHREHLPSYVTIAEAGHLAKVGFNAAGLGMCTNTLVSSRDFDQSGVPYHIVLRALLDAETISAATRMVYTAPRAFSANYLLAHRDGFAINLETTSGDATGVSATLPDDGVVAHSNHFLSCDFAALDVRVAQHPHSLFRLDAMRRGLKAGGRRVDLDRVRATLRNHANEPDAICSHPDVRQNPLERRTTVASVFADLDAGELWLTAGPPCEEEYRHYPYAQRLASLARVQAVH